MRKPKKIKEFNINNELAKGSVKIAMKMGDIANN